MCEFCLKHGDGEKWYLQAKNYSQDLLNDLGRRKFISEFFEPDHLKNESAEMERLSGLPPLVRRTVSSAITRRFKKMHFGQILPLEDIEKIFGFVNSIVRVPCVCRQATLGRDLGYCYGVSMRPSDGTSTSLLGGVDDSYLSGIDTSAFDQMEPDQALEAFASHEKEGMCHSVWTFVTPFIGGICNCDRRDCLAMQATVTHDVKLMFKSEYVAVADPDLCTGCRSCMRVCQFGAMGYSPADKKIFIDQHVCYGCGICRSVCTANAITLKPRAEEPVAAKLW